MKVYDTSSIRNVAVVGHGGCGKTSLVATALFVTGAVNRIGSVEDGTTVTDFDPDEIERKISLQTALAYGEWKKLKLNILDAPGYANFLSEARSALRVADAAVVVVDAVSAVEVQTEKVWSYAEEYGLPRMIVVNRMDRDRASFQRTLESIERSFGRTALPIALPLGEEKDFKGLIDLVSEQALTYAGDTSGKVETGDVPAALKDEATAAREKLVEMVAESNESLMEKFFENGTLDKDDLVQGLHQAVSDGKIVPVFPTSATTNVGVSYLLDQIAALVPSPAERGEVVGKDAAGKEVRRAQSSEAPLSAFVFKTVVDPHAGFISLFRVYSGILKADATIHNLTRDTSERIGSLTVLQGKNATPIQEVQAGDIAAVAKLKETKTNDTLGDKTSPILYPPIVFPTPATTFAIEPKSRGDEDKISSALHRLMEEDPVIQVRRDAQTHQTLISGMGQLHIEVVVGKLRKRFKVEVTLDKPKIPYRETIKGAAEGHGRHKKQTGGHGQFGDCKIRMRPLPRGEDFKFTDDTFGGSIPKNFIPAIEKGIQDARMRGFLAGYPLVDLEVEVYDGQYHDVDSSEMSFKIAGSLAYKDTVARCKPTILEPIMKVEIVVPEEFAGSVMGDLSGRRGHPQGMEPQGHNQCIRAEVPMAEMLTFDADLTSMTGARGSYTMEMSHYAEVPAHLQEKIIAAAKAEKGEEKAEDA